MNIQNFVIDSHLFAGKLEAIISKSSFATSLEVVSEVMNVPMVAVKAIARQAGLPTDDTRSICIDENVLRQKFSSAFVRKTKNYFLNCVRNSAALSPSDLQIFIDFCKSFKKQNIPVDDVTEWSQIDTDKIREEFIIKIKEKTQEKQIVPEIFSGTGNFEAREYEEYAVRLVSKFSISNDTITNNVAEDSATLFCFTSTWCYRAQKTRRKSVSTVNIVINHIYIPAHYYIYIDDDDHPKVSAISFSEKLFSRMVS